jgi:hypothetical protein
VFNKNFHSKSFNGISLCLGDIRNRLQLREWSEIDDRGRTHLYKGLTADAIEFIEVCGECKEGVDVSGVENVIILAQLNGALHRPIVVP